VRQPREESSSGAVMDWGSSSIVLLIVGVFFSIGKAYLDGFSRGLASTYEAKIKATVARLWDEQAKQ